MKKILIGIVIILLSVIAYTTIVNGYSIGKLNVLGLNSIKENNQKLESKIEEAEKLKSVTYVSKMSELSSAARELIKEKKSYEELITYSDEEDIQKAKQTQKYEVEVLWTKVGTYATKNGVKLKLDITQSSSNTPNANDLKFIATGSYISISDFVADLERDSKLSFTIENFALIPASTNNTEVNDNNLQATFKVSDISLNLNNSNFSTSTSKTDSSTSQSTTKNTSTTK